MSYLGNKLYGLINRTNKLLLDNICKEIIYMNNSINDNHYISFTFDDFESSAATYGLEILDTYNVKATYYVSYSIKNKMEFGKKMYSNEDLNRVHSEGHEIGCHTFDHLDCKENYFYKVKDSIEKNIQSISKIFPGITFDSFSYPYGRYDFLSKKIVKSRFKTARTTNGGINQGIVDLHLLKANKLYSNTIPLQRCYDLIDLNKNQKSWLIFYTHDIEHKPSTYGCDPVYLEKVIDYAINSNAIILPVIDIYNILHNLNKN